MWTPIAILKISFYVIRELRFEPGWYLLINMPTLHQVYHQFSQITFWPEFMETKFKCPV